MKLSNCKLNPNNATTVLGLWGLIVEALVILGVIDEETKNLLITLLSSFVGILFRVALARERTNEI